jgi:hypothetical protein
MTGRRAGFCAGFPVPGFLNPWPGFGRGWRRFWGFPVPAAYDEKEALKVWSGALRRQLEAVEKRLAELEAR